MRIGHASILKAFDAKCVGSRVTDPKSFCAALDAAVEAFDFNADTNPKVDTTGQGVVPLPTAVDYVSAGVGHPSDDPDDYVLREWRGSVKAYLKREYAAPVESLAVVVYTVEAYLADPDVGAAEGATFRPHLADHPDHDGPCPDYTHVIVAVLAGAGPKPPAYTVGRLVANLAGGNKDALAWDADKIRSKAKEAAAYAAEWTVVAD